MRLEKGQRVPNAGDFGRRVDTVGEESKYFIYRGKTTVLELNSRFIAGERLTV